jgi:cellulose synthase operon protein C
MRKRTIALALTMLASPLLAISQDAAGYRDKARAALARGDGIAAEADLQRAQAAGASKVEIAADMGEAYLQQGEGAKAREWLTPGQFEKDQQGRGWRLLGLLERLDGNLPAAGKALDRAIAAAPGDPLLWVEVGRLRYQGGEQLQSLDAADRALSANPDDPRALEFKAQLVLDARGDAAALPYYEKALVAAPTDLSVLGGYAAALGDLGRASEMLAVTRKMLSLDPGHPQAFYLQAVLAARAGDTDLARAMLNRSGERLEGIPAAVVLLGALELEAGNANAAAQRFDELAGRQPNNPRVQMLLARALYESGDFQRLFGRFGALSERADASPYLLAILGRAAEEQGDRAAAANYLDRAAAANPPTLLPMFEAIPPGVLAPDWNANQGSLDTATPYVRSLLSAGDKVGARRVASRLLELHKGSSEALGLMGDVELQSGQPQAALANYELSARIRFTDQLALRSAIALEGAGQADKLPLLVGNYLGLFPYSRLMHRVAANQAINAQDWPRARLLLENLRLRGGNRDARLLASLSLALLRSGDAKAALATADRAWQIAPASSFVATLRALAMAHAGGDADAARQLIGQAKKSGGDPKLLQEAAAKLR